MSHPNKKQRAERAIAKAKRLREKMKIWYPKADDLRLCHVPDSDRERIRTRLRPWLKVLHDNEGNRTPVKYRDCWNIAQSLVITAQAPDVKYIEGVYERVNPEASPQTILGWWDECPPPHHGWNSVEGFRVDLIAEFMLWQREGDYHIYETQNEYTYEEVKDFLDNMGCWEIMSVFLCGNPIPEPDWDKVDFDSPEAEDYFTKRNNFTFQPATDRLIARYRAEAAHRSERAA